MADPSRRKDYSSQVRKKLATSNRTGQACDRCKLRKIRCDADPNGCAGCRAASEACETTDRITRKALRRGHTDILESENTYLKRRLHEFQQKLAELGVPESQLRTDSFSKPHEDEAQQAQSGSTAGLEEYLSPVTAGSETSMWQKHLNNVSGDLVPNPAFSMLRGTKLSLFGMHIDLAEFAENPLDVESPQTFGGFLFHANASNARQHATPPPLPPTLKAAQEYYASWFFKFLMPYTPLLDKGQMQDLLTKVYEDPRPGPRVGRTAAEEVMVHMMFGYIKFQYGQRNKMQNMLDEAMAHFKYCLGFMQDLLCGRTLEDCQAMGMITLQLRAFPRPGASWLCGQIAVNLMVDCGLNRSVESFTPVEKQQMTLARVEIRKRVFWTVYGIVAGLSIRLGRPLPLRLEDIDIEFPQPVHDCLPGEDTGMTEFQKCSFRVGIYISQLLALFGDLYSSFYILSKPPPGEHERLVSKFQSDLQSWRDQIPSEIADSAHAENEVAVHAMYLEIYEAEFRFLLYHPLLQISNQPESYKQNFKQCLVAISDTLSLLLRLRDLKCLDVPGHTTTMLLAMMLTQLFVEDQRSAEITKGEIQILRTDMDAWLDMFGTVGEMLGSGARLQNSVGEIMRNVLNKLKSSVDAKTAGTTKILQPPRPKELYNLPQTLYPPANLPSLNEPKSEPQSPYPTQKFHATNAPKQPYSARATQTTFDYEAAVGAQTMYSTTQLTYNTPVYGVPQTKPPLTQMTASIALSAAQSTYSVAAAPGYYSPQPPNVNTTPANEWMRWSQANLNPFVAGPAPQEYATAGRVAGPAPAGIVEEGGQWPLNIYTLGQGGYGQGGPPG